MTQIGYYALIRLDPLAVAVDAGSNCVNELLAARERDLWARCIARKRKIEFLGGRLAGKLAANLYRLQSKLAPQPLNAIDIYPETNGAPVCEHSDGVLHPISISHSNGWAGALVSVKGRPVSLDIEGPQSRVRPMVDMFHEAELAQIRGVEDARLRWVIKEAYGKLTGEGILGRTDELVTIRMSNRMWLAVPRANVPKATVMLAGGRHASLSMAVGLID